MRTIAHISDLHFGKENQTVADALLDDLSRLSPNLVIISGDLTQRARINQFKSAKEFLDKIEAPKLIVPGNHDIPLFDLVRRFISPLMRYKKFISDELSPKYIDDEISVFCINTARSLTWKNGRISFEQIKQIEEELCSLNENTFKILVTHHPFIPPPGNPGIDLVGRSIHALDIIDKCDVDLLLAGHLHHGYSGDVRTFYQGRKRSVISAQAGTAISVRMRNEPNAYNLILLDKNTIKINIRAYNKIEFEQRSAITYRLINKEWIKD